MNIFLTMMGGNKIAGGSNVRIGTSMGNVVRVGSTSGIYSMMCVGRY